jgi:hypothetical protein
LVKKYGDLKCIVLLMVFRGSSKYVLDDSTARYSKREEETNGSCREYMPSAWQVHSILSYSIVSSI